jgi:hypothetical protein
VRTALKNKYKNGMKTAIFTKEEANAVKQLQQKGTTKSVTIKTEEGIYTFRNVPNVSIFNIRRVVTGSKNPKVEVLFDFCLRSFEVKEGGTYYKDAYSRNLRKLTDTNPDVNNHKSGPKKDSEYDTLKVWAKKEVVDANTEEPKESKGKTKKSK